MKITITFEPNRRLLGIFDMATKLPQNLSPSAILANLARSLLSPFMDISDVTVEDAQ